MHTVVCAKCGYENVVPNVLRCPYCNRNMSNQTDELARKHIRKCAYYLNPYQYSNRGPGRPRKEEYAEQEV